MRSHTAVAGDCHASADRGLSATQTALALGLPVNQYRDGITRKVIEGWIGTH
jgi:hypothetical protein